MFKVLISTLLFSVSLMAAPNAEKNWEVDYNHSNVKFAVKFLKFTDVDGRFTDYTAKVYSKTGEFKDAKVDVVIKAASINTDNAKRDDHLRTPDFFEVAKYPTITFTSKSIEKVDDQNYKVKGDLIMKGVKKSVVLDAVYLGTEKDVAGNDRIFWTAATTINRADFNIKYQKITQAGLATVGEKVDIKLNLQFVPKPTASKQAAAH